MATITETSVEARIIVNRDDQGAVRVMAQGRSLDAGGDTVRSAGVDITDLLSAAQITGATNILTAAENRLKQLWEIA